MSDSFDSETELLPVAVAGATSGNQDRHLPHLRQWNREPFLADMSCDLSEVIEQAVVLGRNRATARNIRLHAYVVEDLCVDAEALEVLSTIDRMLAMATNMAVWGSLIVCEAMTECDKAIVRLRFAGDPPLCDPAGTPIFDCDLRREWPRVGSRHRRHS